MAELARRLREDRAQLWHGRAPLVTGARFVVFVATALWVPVLLLPGDTTAGSLTYATVRQVAAWLALPPVDGVLSPGELLLGGTAAALTAFSLLDYACGTRYAALRVYLAATFWVGLATSYLLANPLAYGTWLFVGFALMAVWSLRVVRREGGDDGDGAD